MYLPAGAVEPTLTALETFHAAARMAIPGLGAPATYLVRWIGLDAESTRQVFGLIRSGDKTGTFSLPWIFERTGQPEPRAGDDLVLIDMDGRPTLLVRLTRVRTAVFGQVTGSDTAIDGSPVRDPVVWKALHTRYWNGLLQPFGLGVTPAMPFWVEEFTLLYDGG